jgi:CheY-like chemotaxis protein
MTESAVADFEAGIWTSDDGPELRPGRVLMSRRRLVLVRADEHRTVPVEEVFDVTGQPPLDVVGEEGPVVTLGVRDGDARLVVTVAASASVLDRFEALLFKLLLNGTDVRLARRSTEDWRPASLLVAPEGLRFDLDPPVAIRTDAVAGARETQLPPADGGDETGPGDGDPGVVLGYTANGERRRLVVAFPRRSTRNVFGRYLATYAGVDRGRSGEIPVLFVDDEPGLAELVADRVQRVDERLSPTVATDAGEGLRALRENPDIRCVVSDYQMPVTDGLEFLSAVRSERPDLPFILFTGKGSEGVASEALAAGATDYLPKALSESTYAELGERIVRAVEGAPHPQAGQPVVDRSPAE